MIKIKGSDNNYYTIIRSPRAFNCNLCCFNLNRNNNNEYVDCDKELLRKVFKVGYYIPSDTLCYHITNEMFKGNHTYSYFKRLSKVCEWKIYLDKLGGKNEIQER